MLTGLPRVLDVRVMRVGRKVFRAWQRRNYYYFFTGTQRDSVPTRVSNKAERFGRTQRLNVGAIN